MRIYGFYLLEKVTGVLELSEYIPFSYGFHIRINHHSKVFFYVEIHIWFFATMLLIIFYNVPPAAPTPIANTLRITTNSFCLFKECITMATVCRRSVLDTNPIVTYSSLFIGFFQLSEV